ncbi:hypothetical protein DPMN_100046 [Dreissena polymorpha]|uniref:Uncharacterized protein n=1 Tax=Dreissena polymorpha TaxID=45954 RepID=A0A9D4LGN6_DREPO|nr:hypothetical protein DPMN_100046 [Dreissena polymorpha]
MLKIIIKQCHITNASRTGTPILKPWKLISFLRHFVWQRKCMDYGICGQLVMVILQCMPKYMKKFQFGELMFRN